jgi:cysteine-rich repeat protein
MKWIQKLGTTAGAMTVAVGMGGVMTHQADAGTLAAGATDGFVMLSSYGKQVNPAGNDTTITGTIGGGTWSVASTKPFFKAVWTAHDGTTFGPGTYTIDTTPSNTADAATYTFTVGSGQVGGHILFDWGPVTDIDVVNVWDVSGNTYTSVDWDHDGKNTYYTVYPGTSVRGGEFIDGPFLGFNANFNFEVTPVCGDGLLDDGEACDDGNTAAGDGCSATCTVESGYSCSGEPSSCSEVCGDGLVVGAEGCDDGGTAAGDGCSATCTVEDGYTCVAEPSVCWKCGNGVIDFTEECDDGGTAAGDGCSATCKVEDGWSCDGADPTTCTETCGDGLVVGAEECDDGNNVDGDGCSANCLIEVPPAACGDGNLDAGEQCDDGNTVDGDGCSANCTIEVPPPVCGDGTVDPGEECDDGNNIDGDGCSAECQLELTKKVTLCHKGRNTITVGAPSVPAHLRHGDTLGECR